MMANCAVLGTAAAASCSAGDAFNDCRRSLGDWGSAQPNGVGTRVITVGGVSTRR